MKIFVLGLPHTQTTKAFTTCAFTMKAYHLCKMLHRRGHEVIHLGTEGSDPECTEHVSVISEERWRKLYGHPGTSFYNLETQAPGHKEYHNDFAANMRAEIMKRTPEPNSAIICVTWGGAQQIAVQDLPQFVVESGIGYPHTWAKYRVFEWRNTTPMPGHPQTLTEELFAKAFEGWERVRWDVGMLDEPGLWDEYIALVVRKS